jgi:hypothetical protein
VTATEDTAPAAVDEAFCAAVAGQLAGLPGVCAVSLGGSRAAGTAAPDSDWDFALYYRGSVFDPEGLRALGWPGEIFPIGGWGGGVFNGGAWLQVGGRRVDVIYRDLDVVEHHLREAQDGRFDIERLLFYLAGVPTYIVAAELATHRVLHGTLPQPGYPMALRCSAPERWRNEASYTLGYAWKAHASRGQVAQTVGTIAVAACQAAHAVLAARGEWVLNEKTLLRRAGLDGIDAIVAGLTADPGRLTEAVDAASALLQSA